MKLRRRHRILTVLIALFGMLFMQLAVASHACLVAQAGTGPERAQAQAQAPDMASMPDCDQPHAAQPPLCHAHCQDGKASLDKAEAPVLAPPVVMVSAILTPLDATFQGALPSTQPASLLLRATAAPMSIRHCCFRI